MLFGIEFRTKKSTNAYVYLPQSGAGGLERYPFLKYYNVEKWKSRFTLGLDATKNTHHIKKGFK